jgi:hypothetical protein
LVRYPVGELIVEPHSERPAGDIASTSSIPHWISKKSFGYA